MGGNGKIRYRLYSWFPYFIFTHICHYPCYYKIKHNILTYRTEFAAQITYPD